MGRELVGHPTAKGDVAEFDWNGAIDGFLPGRYAVSNAFVIDADGQVSEQIEHGGAKFIPAESVFAIFEVKQELNRRGLAPREGAPSRPHALSGARIGCLMGQSRLARPSVEPLNDGQVLRRP